MELDSLYDLPLKGIGIEPNEDERWFDGVEKLNLVREAHCVIYSSEICALLGCRKGGSLKEYVVRRRSDERRHSPIPLRGAL